MDVYVHTKDNLTIEEGIFVNVVITYLKTTGKNLVKFPDRNSYMVVLGGDGATLAAARMCSPSALHPLLIINLGHLGFLSSASPSDWQQALDDYFRGRYSTTKRTMLSAIVNQKSAGEYPALNDIVIAKDGLSKLVRVALYIIEGPDKKLISEYRADGLIISTPTGSTAYNLSAGGPIIHPSCNSYVVTPICPQGLTQRPLVLPSDVTIQIKPLDSNLIMSIDGQMGLELLPNDEIDISCIYAVQTVNPSHSYFEVLRNKLAWGIQPIPTLAATV